LTIIRNTRKALLLAELRNITSQKKLPITPGKPQAATQAKYAFVPPAPYLPVVRHVRIALSSTSQFMMVNKKEITTLKILCIRISN